MAIVELGVMGSAQNKVAGTTLAITNSTGAIIPAGTLLVLSYASDNFASTIAPTVTLANTGSDAWTRAFAPIGSGNTTTAGSGIWHFVFYVRVSADVAIGATITTITTTSVVAKAGVILGFSGVTSTLRGTVATAVSTAGTPSVASTGTALVAGDLVIGTIGTETNAVPTSDSDTLNGSWAAIQGISTTGSSAATNVATGIQSKIVTATGVQTYNPVGANDSVASILALTPDVATPIVASDSGAITITEVVNVDAFSTPQDTAAITINESSSVSIINGVTASDTAAITITESPTTPGPLPYSDLGVVSSATATSAGTTLTFVNTSGATIPAGALLVFGIASDNPASTTAPTFTTPINNTGGTFNFLATSPRSSGVTTTAGSGIHTWSFYLYTTVDITAGSTISSLVWSASVVSKAGIVNAYTGVTGAAYATASTASAGGNPGISTSATVTSGDLVVGLVMAENNTSTGDSDTLNGSWSSLATATADTGTALTSIRVGIQNKVVTATGTQTYNSTVTNDAGVHVGAFSVIPSSGGGTVNVSASDSAAISLGEFSSKPNLQRFKTALANRETARVNVGLLGASIIEGFPATADKTPGQYLAKRLRTLFPTSTTPTGHGFISLPSSAMAGINPWSITPGTGGIQGTLDAATGWGGNHTTWYTTVAALPPILVLTIPNAPWTSFDLDILQAPTYSATGGLYRVDGGSWIPFSLRSPGPAGGQATKIHVASAVTSTIEVTIDPAAAGSYVIVNGITGYNGDEGKGIEAHSFGHSGFKVSQWQSSAQPNWDYRFDQFDENLDLLILSDLGVNDAQAISSAQFAINLRDFVDYLNIVHNNTPMVMVSAWDVTGFVSYVESWTNYRDVMKNFCAARGIMFIDLSTIMPNPPNAIYYTDNVHGNTAGDAYKMMADVISFAITDYGMSADTGAITITESSNVVPSSGTTPITGAESEALTITETSSVFVTQPTSESEALTITETRTLDGSSTSTESEAVTITESRSLAGSSTSTESEAVTITESSAVLNSFASSESEAVTIAENSSVSVSNTGLGNETVATTIVETSTVAVSFASSETEALTISESNTSFATISRPESEALTITDSSAVMLSMPVATSESEAVMISDISNVASSTATSDTASISIADVSQASVFVATFDTGAITIADTSLPNNAFSTTDTAAITIAETSSVFIFNVLPGNESVATTITETSSVSSTGVASESEALTIAESRVLTSMVVTSDTAAVTIADTSASTSNLVGVESPAVTISDTSAVIISTTPVASESEALTIAESRALAVTQPTVESEALTIAETRSLAGSSTSVESEAVSITETSLVSSVQTTSESEAITITEASSLTISSVSLGQEQPAVTITETSVVAKSSPASESEALTITESSALDASSTRTESEAVTITESRALAVSLSTSDIAVITITETTAGSNQTTANDTAAISVDDVSSLVQIRYVTATDTASITITEASNETEISHNQSYAYVNGSWVPGTMKVYHNGAWVHALARVYRNGIWT